MDTVRGAGAGRSSAFDTLEKMEEAKCLVQIIH